MSRRVVITGMGVVTSLGETVDELWEALCAGRSGIKTVTRWDFSKYPVRFGGECTNFDVTRYNVDTREAKRLDRFGQFGIAASVNAVKDAGLDFDKEDRFRCGVLIGSGIGGIETLEEQNKILIERGVSRVSPFTVPRLMVNAASGNVSIMFGINGPNTAVATACATGANAIGDAMRFIQHDMADVMIAGGSEAALCGLGMASFIAARALSTRNEEPTKASRPWDKGRDGFVMGEGAGVVILEDYEHAKARGAKIYAEVIGYGLSGDAYHITSPSEDGDGAYRCMSAAIKRAGISVSEIDYVNAHGTSTPLGDEIELKAVERLVGNAAGKLTMSSTKSAVGHLLGAAGAVEAIFSVLAMRDGIVPPTINLDNPSVDTAIDLVPKTAKRKDIDVALSNSFGFGGTNASLIFRRVS